jgi:hypothetical protein
LSGKYLFSPGRGEYQLFKFCGEVLKGKEKKEDIVKEKRRTRKMKRKWKINLNKYANEVRKKLILA